MPYVKPQEHGGHEEQAGGESGDAGLEPEGLDTALHFPAAGTDGLWFIPFNGDVIEAKLISIQGSAESWTATLSAPFGALQVSGKGAFGSDQVAGTIVMGKEQLGFEGKLQSP